VSPARILDTRADVGWTGPLGAGGLAIVQVGGVGGVADDATAVVLNVTVTDTTAPSFLTLWPLGDHFPTASNLNWTAGQTVPNLVTVKLGSAGRLALYNLAGNVNVIADVAGYYVDTTLMWSASSTVIASSGGVSCPSGQVATGGGITEPSGGPAPILSSGGDADRWNAELQGTAPLFSTVQVFCLGTG
jgi:hypothetical protein